MDQILAAIIGAVVTGLLAFIAYQYQQRSGNRVIVKMLSQTPQITFADSVQQKLEIIYNGRKVKDLVLTQFSISNQGSKIIKPLKLTVDVKPKPGSKTTVDLKITAKEVQPIINNFTYAELNVSDPQEITISRMDSETGTFEIERPYLNPQKKYTEEEIKVSVFSDIVLDFSVSGGGEDWGTKLITVEESKKRQLIFTSIVPFVAFSTLLAFAIYNSKSNTTVSDNNSIVAVMFLITSVLVSFLAIAKDSFGIIKSKK